MVSKKDLNYYTSLPYKVEIIPEEDGDGFNASIPDLKGCVAVGDTVEEAYQIITEVKQTWIEIALERGWRIPEPTTVEIKEYSGKFSVRLARTLHRELAELAEAEGTSLNQLVATFLAAGVEKWTRERQSVRKAVRPFLFEEFTALRRQILSTVSAAEPGKKDIAKSSWPFPSDTVQIKSLPIND